MFALDISFENAIQILESYFELILIQCSLTYCV